MLQPEMEAEVQPGGFNKADYLTGDWRGYRDRLQASGVEVFAFYNSIFSGNVSGGIHPHHATYVDDAYFGMKFDLKKLSDGGEGSLLSAASTAMVTLSQPDTSAAFIRRSRWSAVSGRFFIRSICSKSSGDVAFHLRRHQQGLRAQRTRARRQTCGIRKGVSLISAVGRDSPRTADEVAQACAAIAEATNVSRICVTLAEEGGAVWDRARSGWRRLRRLM
jgi:hypothetical protein